MDTNSLLDSSVILYAFDKSAPDKSDKSFELIRAKLIVTPQVLFETLFVLLRKVKLSKPEAANFLHFLLRNCRLHAEDHKTVDTALALFNKYLL